jgi:RNA polymerase sigma factor (TIGR02999 family)
VRLKVCAFEEKKEAMHFPSAGDVTLLLRGWRCGDAAALQKLVPLVYDELHRLAHRYMRREQADHVLQTTALVNEAYLRLIDAKQVEWQDRAHFFAISANLMRRILVEFARSRRSGKRGGDGHRINLDESAAFPAARDTDLVLLNDALDALAKADPREAQVVELRFFGGLSAEETAEVLKVSTKTVMREWSHAKVWLLHELKHRGQE